MAGTSRRDFLRRGGAAALGAGFGGGVGAAGAELLARGGARTCIVVWQGGGASHLDTFDMKPEAPREIRGEFRPMRTSAPGIEICEHLPLTARIAHLLTVVRSMHASDTNHERATRALLEGLAPERVLFAGSRGFDTHADHFHRLKERVLPEFDRTFSGLVTALDARGLLATTLVVAMGEFGRTPRINAEGGRDHHAGAWSVVLAGGGLTGGRVVGATDRTGSEPVETPVTPADLVRTIRAILGRGEAGGGRVVQEILG
ncbi:MAG: DUF1501 domain-containing protein [Acidobacteriota bacterium]